MRVKVEYSIDLEEIPEEMSLKILNHKKVLDSLQLKLDKVLTNMDSSNFLEACNEMKLFTNDCTKINECMIDCYNILMGYLNYKTKDFTNTNLNKEIVDESTE